MLRHSAQLIFTMLLTLIVVTPATLLAADLAAPVIRLAISDLTPKPGKPIAITAAVHDNEAIARVLLHYRQADSQEAYTTLAMRHGADTSLYSATIPGDRITPPGVEYFVEAIDTTGNISQEPFPNHPRRVAVTDGSSGAAIASGHKINWLWVAAGVVAVGALAASGGSGGGSGEPGSSGGTPTGATLTITAPTP